MKEFQQRKQEGPEGGVVTRNQLEFFLCMTDVFKDY